MQSLSVSKAWDEARGQLARDGGLMVPVALMFFALPNILFQALAIPADFAARAQAGELTMADFGGWIYWSIPVLIANVVGIVAINALVVRGGLSVGEALTEGARRTPAVLGAWVLAIVVPSVLAGIVVGLVGAVAPAAAILLNIAFLLAFIFLLVRLTLLTPAVAVAEGRGPVGLLKRSWALTRGSFWRLLGLLLLAGVLFLVIGIAVGAIAGIIVALVGGVPIGPTGLVVLQIVSGVVNAVLALILYVVLARAAMQLAAPEASVPPAG